MAKILVVDDEKSLRVTVAAFLEAEGHEVIQADSFMQASNCLEQWSFDGVVSDIVLGDKTGIEVLALVKGKDELCPVILVTGYPNMDTATEAVRKNAFDYISKPVYKDNLLNVVNSALEYRERMQKKVQQTDELQNKSTELEEKVEEQAREIKAAYKKLVDADPVHLESLRKLIQEEFDKKNIQVDKMVLPEHSLNLEQHINDIVKQALEINNHNKTKTARYLGITRDVLRSRLKNLEL